MKNYLIQISALEVLALAAQTLSLSPFLCLPKKIGALVESWLNPLDPKPVLIDWKMSFPN